MTFLRKGGCHRMNKKTGKVYLVGAGCGKADLITVRGLTKLRTCDVLIYDDLTDPELLSACPPGAEIIYMGKRSGKHSASQEEINRKIIAKALEGKTVCRLKGGDPFVFGRGGEEMMALLEAGIPCEEIPGISSAIAIPAAAGIPVTHRKLSRSFHVITAHTADTADGLPRNFDQLAQLDGTLVFLMGLSQLEKISQRLIQAGMDKDLPAAVLSGGNSPYCVSVRGSLKDIAARARAQQVKAPAVIVVGQVAALTLSSTVPRPLEGITVGLTGTASVSDKLKALLEDMGANAFSVQRSSVHALQTDFDLNTLGGDRTKWIVFTSGNGVRRFFDLLREQSVDLRSLYTCKFAVIGVATAKVLSEYGFLADLCPSRYTGEALAQELLHRASPDEPLFIFRSAQGSPLLYEKLAEKFTVRDIHTYTTISDPCFSRRAEADLQSLDYLCFSSAGGVTSFFVENKSIPGHVKCVCIGETTANALKQRYSGSFINAGEISVEGMVKAICEDVQKNISAHAVKEPSV